MKIYVVYNRNEDGSCRWVDSYWQNRENALARFKKIWPYGREPFKSEIDYYVEVIKTED